MTTVHEFALEQLESRLETIICFRRVCVWVWGHAICIRVPYWWPHKFCPYF